MFPSLLLPIILYGRYQNHGTCVKLTLGHVYLLLNLNSIYSTSLLFKVKVKTVRVHLLSQCL